MNLKGSWNIGMKVDIERLVRRLLLIVQVGDDETVPDVYVCENVCVHLPVHKE